MIGILELVRALEKAWTKETSVDPKKWSSDNPALGQCAVTSLTVNDYLGGEIVWAVADLPKGGDESHYFNKINGITYDLTKRQFPDGTKIPEGIPRKKEFSSTREYLLSSPNTKKRYGILKERIESFL